MNIPIVTLDKIYIKQCNNNVIFLDCTRVDGIGSITRTNKDISSEIDRIVSLLDRKEIMLADDVVYSGNALRFIIEEFNKRGIKVVGIITSIVSKESLDYFNNNLKYGVRCNYILGDYVIDQVCERDFYFGIAGSGIYKKVNNELYKAPYFKPFGNPDERASIPSEWCDYFSKGCLDRSLVLWEEIDRLSSKETLIRELPERIIKTDCNDSVVKTLRREIKK